MSINEYVMLIFRHQSSPVTSRYTHIILVPVCELKYLKYLQIPT